MAPTALVILATLCAGAFVIHTFTPNFSPLKARPLVDLDEPPALSLFSDVMHNQILQDLAPFKNGIAAEALDKTFETYPRKRLVRILFWNNRLYIKKMKPVSSEERFHATHMFYIMLIKMLCRYQVPNMEVVFNLDEKPIMLHNESEPLPIFSWPKTSSHWDIQYPYWNFAWLPKSSAEVELEALNSSQWRSREPIAVWRGQTTGGIYKAHNWNTTLRSRLVAMCGRRPDLCDAKFTGIVQAHAEAIPLIRNTYGLHPGMPLEEQERRFKYQIVLGGNGRYCASRSFKALKSKMTPLWVFTEHMEFFYPLLRPYEHYVPVSHDLEDLYARIEWARDNPLLAERIAIQGQEFARKYFHTEFASAYISTLLLEYSKLQLFTPVLTPHHLLIDVNDTKILRGLQRQAGSCNYWRND